MNTIVFVGEHLKTYDVKWHTHDTWELVYCTSGQGSFRFQDGRTIPYRAGEAVLIPPNLLHANSGEEGFTNLHVNILEPSFPYSEVFKVRDEDGLLGQAVSAACTYYSSRKIKRELVLASLGELLISYVIVFRSNREYSEPVELIRREILKNHSNPDFALDAFIRSMPFHYDYLRKIFKKEIGLSPLEYTTGLRMKNAERLLSGAGTGGCAIGEIAHMCGYENALYFSRVFKKYYGCSPTQFLQRQSRICEVDPGRREAEPEK